MSATMTVFLAFFFSHNDGGHPGYNPAKGRPILGGADNWELLQDEDLTEGKYKCGIGFYS